MSPELVRCHHNWTVWWLAQVRVSHLDPFTTDCLRWCIAEARWWAEAAVDGCDRAGVIGILDSMPWRPGAQGPLSLPWERQP